MFPQVTAGCLPLDFPSPFVPRLSFFQQNQPGTKEENTKMLCLECSTICIDMDVDSHRQKKIRRLCNVDVNVNVNLYSVLSFRNL